MASVAGSMELHVHTWIRSGTLLLSTGDMFVREGGRGLRTWYQFANYFYLAIIL